VCCPDLVHLSAVSVWLGGLAVLVVALLWRGAAATDDEIEAVVGRFSQVAFAAVVAIVVSGTVQGWRQVGGYDALLETSYGRLLVLKVALVGGMLVAAAVSRSWVRQRASRTAALALSAGPGAVAESPGGGPSRLSLLRQSLGVDAGLAVVVLAVTALLVNAVRARRRRVTAGAVAPSPPGSPRTTSSSASTSTPPRSAPCRCTSTSTSPAVCRSSGSRR
jgi:copper transport protein